MQNCHKWRLTTNLFQHGLLEKRKGGNAPLCQLHHCFPRAGRAATCPTLQLVSVLKKIIAGRKRYAAAGGKFTWGRQSSPEEDKVHLRKTKIIWERESSPEKDKLDQVAVADCNNFFGHHRWVVTNHTLLGECDDGDDMMTRERGGVCGQWEFWWTSVYIVKCLSVCLSVCLLGKMITFSNCTFTCTYHLGSCGTNITLDRKNQQRGQFGPPLSDEKW